MSTRLLAVLLLLLTASMITVPPSVSKVKVLLEETEKESSPKETKEFKVKEYLPTSERSHMVASNSHSACTAAMAAPFLDGLINAPSMAVAVPPPERST